MPPIELTSVGPVAEALADVEALLVKDGKPTLESEVLAHFFEHVDMDAIMDEPELAECIESVEAHLRFNDAAEEVEVLEAEAEGTEPGVVETLAGEIVAETIDEDDLLGLFEHYVLNLPESTMEEKLRKSTALSLMPDLVERLDEASVFKKGDFRKIHKGTVKTANGKTGPLLVKRMLIAMLKKEAIKRAKTSGKGYRGGDYEKNGAGYGGGTPSGKKAVALYKGKSGAKLKAAARKVKGAASAEAKLKAKAKSKDAAKKAKANALAKKKPTKGGDKKSLVAHDDSVPASNLAESSLGMAGRLVSRMPRTQSLNESKK
jgi:hypothetical protein